MRRGRIYLFFIAVITAAAVVVVGSAAAQSHKVRQRATSAASATIVDPLQTITPYQLEWMHLYLGPAPQAVAISASQADQALEAYGIAAGGGPILETVLATCSKAPEPVTDQLPWANRPCWVVSVQPGKGEVFGPPTANPPAPVDLTVEYALVDADTGQVFDEAAGNPPAQAP